MDKIVITSLTLLIASVIPSLAVEPAPTSKSVPEVKPESTMKPLSAHRLIGGDRTAWIAEMRTKLPMARRPIGPFGLVQDPGRAAVKPKPKVQRTEEFLNAIAAMQVNAVIGYDHSFVVGAREFSRGDKFPLVRGQRKFITEIVSVNTDNIVFKNIATGEHVKKNLNKLPPGMTKGSGIDSVPGVEPATKKSDEPLTVN